MFQVIERPKLYEQVVERIKDMIVQGIYQKGDLLPSEKELTEMTGVSRITVREALRLLNEAGVIETKRGKGSFVMVDGDQLQRKKNQENPKIDYPAMFLYSTEARLLLEPALVRQLSQTATDEELQVICDALHHKGKGDFQYSFHTAIMKASHNPILEEWCQQLHTLEAETMVLTLVPPANQKSVAAKIDHQHQKICDALLERDGEFAYLYMKEHLRFIKNIYEEYFKIFY